MVPKKHLLQRLLAHLQVLFNLRGNLTLLKNHELDQFKKEILQTFAKQIPFCNTLGIGFDCLGNEITTHLPFKKEFIGNPATPIADRACLPISKPKIFTFFFCLHHDIRSRFHDLLRIVF